MLSFFRSNHEFAIDLGTNNTLIYQPKRGIILDEPTSIAFDNKRSLFCGIGASSLKMVGKTPANVEVMHPLSKGAIANLTVAKAYIKEVMKRITNSRFFKPSIIVSVPSDLNAMERNAVVEACKEGGAREVMLIKDPFSAALGASLAIEKPKGLLVLDIGAGVSDISLLSCNGIVMSKSLRMAGNDLSDAIIEYFKEHHRVLIASREAEMLKHSLGDLGASEEKRVNISVKNMTTRLPERFEVSSLDVNKALVPLVQRIVSLTHGMLSIIPPAFAQDIYDHGIVLTGGSSMLKGFDSYLSKRLEIAINPIEDPLHNIILGAGRVLEERRYSRLLDVL